MGNDIMPKRKYFIAGKTLKEKKSFGVVGI